MQRVVARKFQPINVETETENMASRLLETMVDMHNMSGPNVDTVNSNKATEYQLFATAGSDIGTLRGQLDYCVDRGVEDVFRVNQWRIQRARFTWSVLQT